jgi:hypothetical protein
MRPGDPPGLFKLSFRGERSESPEPENIHLILRCEAKPSLEG